MSSVWKCIFEHGPLVEGCLKWRCRWIWLNLIDSFFGYLSKAILNARAFLLMLFSWRLHSSWNSPGSIASQQQCSSNTDVCWPWGSMGHAVGWLSKINPRPWSAIRYEAEKSISMNITQEWHVWMSHKMAWLGMYARQKLGRLLAIYAKLKHEKNRWIGFGSKHLCNSKWWTDDSAVGMQPTPQLSIFNDWPLWNCRNDPRSLQKVPRKQHSHVHWSLSI